MIKPIFLLVIVIGALLILASRRPDRFRLERSMVINATPEALFALISDLQQFNRWNPWNRKDPAIQGSYSSVTSGVGASYAWESKVVGSGRMTITAAEAPKSTAMQLDFFKPFKAQNTADLTLHAEGTGTRVVWGMAGENNLMSKLMQVFVSMDAMVGKDFEAGLANLKELAEQAALPHSPV